MTGRRVHRDAAMEHEVRMQAYQTDAARPDAAATGSLLLAGWAVSTALVTWFVLGPLKDAMLDAFLGHGALPGPSVLLRFALGRLTAGQSALLLLAASTTIALVILEIRQQAVSAALRSQSWQMLLAYVALVAWFGHSYLGRGHLLSGDTSAHLSMVASRTLATLSGEDPYWSNFKRLGLPLQGFYSPTTFWPLTWIAAVWDPTVALRLFLFAMHVLSGLAAYLMGRQLGLSRTGAFLGGLAYTGAFAHLHALLYRGNIPLALSMVLLPLAFLYLHQVLTARIRRVGSWIGLALAAAGLLVNYTPFGIIAGIYLALFALILMGGGMAPWQRLVPLSLAAIVAAALAAFALVPAALSGSEVKPVSLAELVYLAWPSAEYFNHLLVWRAWRTDMPGATAYLGITVVLLAGVGALALVRNRLSGLERLPVLAMLGFLALSLVLRGAHVRDFAFTLLFVSVLAGIGAGALADRFARRSVPAAILALLLVDLGSTAVQPIGRSDKGFLEAAGSYLASQPPARFMEGRIEDGLYRYDSGAGILTWYPAESAGGGHVEMATPAWVYGDMAGLMVEADLRSIGRLQPETRDFLCLLRVERILAATSTSMGMPASVTAAEPEGPLGRVVRTRCAYNLTFSQTLVPADFPPMDPGVRYGDDSLTSRLSEFLPFVHRLLSEMAVNPDTGIAQRILVPGLKEPIAVTSGGSTPSAVATRSYEVTLSRVRVSIESTTEGFVRLSHAWHPRLQVLRNGKPVAVYRDITNCIVVPVSAGMTVIEIAPGAEPARIFGGAVSLAALLGLAVFAVASMVRPIARSWRVRHA